MGIVDQLVEIYREEKWHKTRMDDVKAFEYHKKRYDRGDIVVYEEEGVVLGYYEKEYIGDCCFLKNVYILERCRKGKVFNELKKHLFKNLPYNIKYIIGEKQKIGGKFVKGRITNASSLFRNEEKYSLAFNNI